MNRDEKGHLTSSAGSCRYTFDDSTNGVWLINDCAYCLGSLKRENLRIRHYIKKWPSQGGKEMQLGC